MIHYGTKYHFGGFFCKTCLVCNMDILSTISEVFYTLPCAGIVHAVFADQKMECSISPLKVLQMDTLFQKKGLSIACAGIVHNVLGHTKMVYPIPLTGVLQERFPCSIWEFHPLATFPFFIF